MRGDVAQDRHLAEELPAPQCREHALLPVVLADDLDLAVDDDEELVRRRPLAHDHRARLDLERVQLRGERRRVPFGQVAEDAVARRRG